MPRIGLLGLFLCCLGVPARAGVLPPSADPVTTFIIVADSVSHAGDDALSAFVRDNAVLVGASVASLLDVAFQVRADNPEGARENVDFARRIATLYQAGGGSGIPAGLVDAYETWTPAQRKSRDRALALDAQAVAARKAGDVDNALDLLAQARALYEKIGDRHSVAVSWGSAGLTRWGTGDWDAVAADYGRALDARRAVEDRILEGRTLNGLGSAHQQKGDYDQALDYYRQAVELRRRTGDLGGLGTSLTYTGHVYNTIGRYVDARNYYEQALPILEELGNPQQMVELLSGIALLNKEMGRMADADAAYQRAIDLAQANGLGDVESICRRNLAESYRTQGRYSEAMGQVEAAMVLLEANPNPEESARAFTTRGLTYMNMGELDDARADLVKCAELAPSLENPEHAILAQLNIGALYRELGAFERGLTAADQARTLSEQAGNARTYRDAMALRGDLEFRLGRYDDALVSWGEALAQDEYDHADRYVLFDHVGIANVYAGMGKTAEARSRLRPLLRETHTAGRRDLEWATLLAMGHSFEAEDVDSASFYYEKALAGIEAAGADAGSAETQTGYLSGLRRFYYEEVTRFYAQTGVATGDETWSARAFHTIERAKARGLLELLQARVGDATSPEESALLDELYSLDPKQSDYANRRAALENRYADLRAARVQAAVGSLAQAPAIIGMDAVARELPKKTVMLEYALGDSASLVWVIDRDARSVVQLPARAVIEAEVRRMRDALARMDAGAAALLASSRKLYQLLVEPAKSRLDRAETAIIVPDGVLFELPFEALLSADPAEGAAWSAQPFLAREVATIYAPSATVYVSLKNGDRERTYAIDLFAAGNPDFGTLAPQTGAAPLAPLPFANDEVAAISARVQDRKKRVVTGADATEALVKQELRGGTPRVVHLATHGLVDASEPSRSSVALTADGSEDGYFHTLEILATPTTSGLVVMSACESARGKVSRGEGVVGLSRAFLAAGAGSVVASLWAVSDESTAELMKAFYEQMLGKKKPASRALNEARLALIA
ncbi:MAG TPA: CHAT domain-containing tetratricopeptide repeat protein, partial [Candidatus Krumholzibacteria bacterium]|nr:CHAT domain-containing tetratricopeptide repeat protein [Candidatus Krumholzibacteria bacterium]